MAYDKGDNNYNKGRSGNSFRAVIYMLLLAIVVLACIVLREPITQQLYTWKESTSAFFDKKADVEDEDILLNEVVENDTVTSQMMVTYTTIDTDSVFADAIDVQDIIETTYTEALANNNDIASPSQKSAPTATPDKTKPIETKNKERYLVSFTGNNRKYGFKDTKTGEVVIEPQYDRYLHINDKTEISYIAVERNNKYGIIDLNNQIVAPFIYDNIEWAHFPTYWKVSRYDENRKRSVGLINATNAKLMVPVEFEALGIVGPVSFIIAKKNGKYGCIDNNNRITVPIIYNSYSVRTSSNESRNMVVFYDKDNNKFCFDKNGSVLDCQ